MGKRYFIAVPAFAVAFAAFPGCERLDNDIDRHADGDPPFVALEDVARLLTEVRIDDGHLEEVHHAVSSSSDNGYDEEYTMRDLFAVPGSGVGDSGLPEGTRSAVAGYASPLRDAIRERLLSSGMPVKSSPGICIPGEEYLSALESSDIQIYWPYSENWDGETYPVITFDPADGSDINVGYRIARNHDGEEELEKVIVDEAFAEANPVWVINRNDDAGYTSLEMLRRQDPDWGSGGGSVIVKPSSVKPVTPLRTLVLKDFTMHRNYDSWFAGASEFFVKTGSVEDFTASTEAELKLYSPTVTDFMIVVKRKYVGKPVPFNAVLVSDWTDQLDQCAFMITEDDGGTRTSWKCSAVVKVASKSYGFEINLPFNTRDDIVWRGQLSRRYIEANNGIAGHFGDVDLTFEIMECQAL